MSSQTTHGGFALAVWSPSTRDVVAAISGGFSRGMRLGHPPSVRDIRDLVEELPECESKGALRGLATAARVLDGGERQQILERMAAVVQRWKENDPVAALDAELGRRLRNSAVRP
jgi:hypothetical protein